MVEHEPEPLVCPDKIMNFYFSGAIQFLVQMREKTESDATMIRIKDTIVSWILNASVRSD